MHFEGYVDIFDAGPVLQARVSELRALRESALATVDDSAVSDEREPVIVSNTTMADFRMILVQGSVTGGRIALTDSEQQLLNCRSGDQVRTLTLNVRKNAHG
jgi:arginine N-succinyltransferase